MNTCILTANGSPGKAHTAGAGAPERCPIFLPDRDPLADPRHAVTCLSSDGAIEARREVADPCRKYVRAARSEAQRLGKTLTDVIQRRNMLEHEMRPA